MHTHYLSKKEETESCSSPEVTSFTRSGQSILAVGIVAQYCPGLDECYIVFDSKYDKQSESSLADESVCLNSHDKLLLPR